MTRAERIKKRREELGLTQSELANRMGFKGKSSISKIESSGNKVTLKTVEKAANALNCSVSYILGMVDNPYMHRIQDEIMVIRDRKGLPNDHLPQYAQTLYDAYKLASHDTQAAVRAILHIEEDLTDADR